MKSTRTCLYPWSRKKPADGKHATLSGWFALHISRFIPCSCLLNNSTAKAQHILWIGEFKVNRLLQQSSYSRIHSSLLDETFKEVGSVEMKQSFDRQQTSPVAVDAV